MNHLKRGVAVLAATSLATVGLVAGAAPGQAAGPAATPTAAPGAGTLTWQISAFFDEHLSTHVLDDGATEDAAGVVTFPAGVGSHDPGTGVTRVAYDGSVAGSFALLGTTYYTVTIADPVVTVDPDGEGTISAVVAAENAAAMGNPAASTPPARVVVTTFDADAATWADDATTGLDTLAAVPRWAGVLEPGSAEATELDMKPGVPVDGKSFAPTFLRQLTPGVRGIFHASGANADSKKAPAAFSAQVAPQASPQVVVKTTRASYAGGLDLAVAGTGFTPVTNPGDDGVYVGLAESGALPDTSQMNTELFAGVAWVPAAAIKDGSFSTTMNAATAKLDPRRSYSVYTWRAHSHSTTSQDTETPVVIDWSALAPPATQVKRKATIATTWLTKPKPGKPGMLRVTVRGPVAKPTGKVTVRFVKRGTVKKTRVGALRSGVATVAVPRLGAGAWKVRLAYSGSATYRAATKTLSLTVARR